MLRLVSIIKAKFPTSYLIWLLSAILLIYYFDVLWCSESLLYPIYTSRYLYLTAIVFGLVFTFPIALLRNMTLQVIVLILIAALFEANLMYFRTYNVPIPLSSYVAVGNLSGFASSVIDSVRWYDWGMFIIPIITLCISRKFKCICYPNRICYALVSLFFISLELCMFVLCGGLMSIIDNDFRHSANSVMIVPRYSIFSYIYYDYMLHDQIIDDTEINDIKDWLIEHNSHCQAYSDSLDVSVAESVPDNLLVILCESFESWPIGLSVDGVEITPILNDIVSDSTTYFNPNVVSQVKGGRSMDCQLMSFAGLLPIEVGAYCYSYLSSIHYSLPKAINKAGGMCYLFTGDDRHVWNQESVAEAMGFDELFTKSCWDLTNNNSVNMIDGSVSDEALIEQSLYKIDIDKLWNKNKPTLSAVITRSGHIPFKIDEEKRRISLSGELPELLRDYMETTNYVDYCIGTLIEHLKTMPNWDKTVIVITGDHEGLASHRNDLAAEYSYVDKSLRVPFIVINSKRMSHSLSSEPMGQEDIYPTLLDIMGLYNTYEWRGVGYSLLDSKRPKFAFDSRGRIVGDTLSIDIDDIEKRKRASFVSDRIIRFDLNHELINEISGHYNNSIK